MNKGPEFRNQYRVGQMLPAHAVAMREGALASLAASSHKQTEKVHVLNPDRLPSRARSLFEQKKRLE